ncbi:DUF1405 domain-containing protein (plasmid) [Cytobacillus firmus]|uniref:DUF1405 domain-containing protein n=1 Tax=Bacillaceae TaxID=186817 RepID=UPI001A8E8FAE|nr:DUF1405 domain-containing protein [Bacillus sp. NTK034]MBN8202792.1 DUF1405 domain-containing protein [Bacillus sp. NTK034]
MNLLYLLEKRWFIWALFIINVLGTVYGYIWYKYQLIETPAEFLIFVPDSPTASLFFVFVLGAFLLKKNWPLFEALAIITLFKYGVWAVVMNILTYIVTGSLHWTGYMLILSHAAMAIQGLLYAPYYRIKFWHLVVAAIWTLHNDVIDYVFSMMPWYGVLSTYMPQIGYFTFWLSIVSISIAYLTTFKWKHNKVMSML